MFFRDRVFAVCLLLAAALTACKDDDPPDPANLDPHPPTQPEPTSPPDDEPSPDTRSDERAPRPIDIGTRAEGNIAFPKKGEDLPYETDWYVFEGVEGQSVTFRVEATDESHLRPMISVLIPGEGGREEWTQVGAKRAAADEPNVDLTIELKSAGTRLVAVDDARNVVEEGETSSPVGGEAFGYTLTVERVE